MHSGPDLGETQKPIDGRFLADIVQDVTLGVVRIAALGELEAAVMNHLWDCGDGDAKTVHHALGTRRGITLNTIQSTLKRLYEKRLLARDKVSHAHVYRARVSREAFHNALLGELVGALSPHHTDALVAAFVDLTERAGPEHLQRLEALVAQRRKPSDQGANGK